MGGILYGGEAGRRGRGAALGILGVLLTLAALAGCGRTGPGATAPPPAIRAGDPTGKVKLFLIAPGDAGKSGRKVGCGDSAVPVEVALPQKEPGLQGAIQALLAIKGQHQEPSGLYNALYSSNLTLDRIERQGGEARIYLKGYLELGGECEDPRIAAELEDTARQFTDVTSVRFYLEGKPLQEILAGKG